MKVVEKGLARKRRHKRIRKKIFGFPEKPRLCVYRSNMNIYAQIINDVEGKTIVQASTIDAEIKKELAQGGNKEAAAKVGKVLALRAKKRGIKEVVFDRNGYAYHGCVKALADALRQSGLKF